MKNHVRADVLVTDRLRSYGAALKEIGSADRQETGRWLNNRAENSHLPFQRRERDMLRFRRMRSSQTSASLSQNTSTTNAASRREAISNGTEPPLWPSGAVFARDKGQRHCPS